MLGAGCSSSAPPAAPARPPPPVAVPTTAAPPAPEPPTRIDAVATDVWGRSEGLTLPVDVLPACLEAAPGVPAGWLLLEVAYEIPRRPSKVTVVERHGLSEALEACVVAAIADHEELYASQPVRVVHISVW